MTNWFDIGAADEYCEETPLARHAGGQSLAVFRLGEDVYALRDKCSHGNARLSDGYVEDGCVECPLHQGLIDIRSGAARSAPITEAVRSFPVRVVAGRVEVEVAGQAGLAQEAGGCDGACATPVMPATPASRAVSVRIDSIDKVSADVVVLRLRQDQGAPLDYLAGQYLDVLLADGLRRSYSMATAGGGDQLELHIRHLPGGRFTDHVFSALQAGERLTLEGPAGDFYLRPGAGPALLLASGTGFAPLKALIEAAIAAGNTRPMRLYWGGRKPADLYLDTLCRAWAQALPWFDYVPVISEPAPGDGWNGRTGLVHEAVLQDHADLSVHQVYACGAPPMVAAAQRDFTTLRALPAAGFFADAFLSQADLRQRA